MNSKCRQLPLMECFYKTTAVVFKNDWSQDLYPWQWLRYQIHCLVNFLQFCAILVDIFNFVIQVFWQKSWEGTEKKC